jgi:hypothetical protein
MTPVILAFSLFFASAPSSSNVVVQTVAAKPAYSAAGAQQSGVLHPMIVNLGVTYVITQYSTTSPTFGVGPAVPSYGTGIVQTVNQ